MNYSEILRTLEKASLFEVYRLGITMHALLEQPEKLMAIKRQLHVGMSISYFSGKHNKLADATIDEIRQNCVCVRDKSNGKQWSVPLYAINFMDIPDIHIQPTHGKLDRTQFQVGESVSFLGKYNQETYGVITQLNPKIATVLTREGTQWRIYYSNLFKVLDTHGQHAGSYTSMMIDVTPQN